MTTNDVAAWNAAALDAVRAIWETAAKAETRDIRVPIQPDFHCTECGRKVNTDWEIVVCACTDDPTCDPCCDEYHDRSDA